MIATACHPLRHLIDYRRTDKFRFRMRWKLQRIHRSIWTSPHTLLLIGLPAIQILKSSICWTNIRPTHTHKYKKKWWKASCDLSGCVSYPSMFFFSSTVHKFSTIRSIVQPQFYLFISDTEIDGCIKWSASKLMFLAWTNYIVAKWNQIQVGNDRHHVQIGIDISLLLLCKQFWSIYIFKKK